MGKTETFRAALTSAGARVGRPIRGAADALLAALLNPLCAGCRVTLESPLNGPVCGRCLIDARLADGRYDGALREIIHAFKYEGRRSLARPLGTLLRQSNSRALEDAAARIRPISRNSRTGASSGGSSWQAREIVTRARRGASSSVSSVVHSIPRSAV